MDAFSEEGGITPLIHLKVQGGPLQHCREQQGWDSNNQKRHMA